MSPNTTAAEAETIAAPEPAAPRTNGITEEQKQAIIALAGTRKEGPMTDMWVEEMRKFKERIRQEEIARQEQEEEANSK